MCIVSMVSDGWKEQFPERWPKFNTNGLVYPTQSISREEFDTLKKEVKELKKLLKAAKKFDKITDQPNCEMDDKINFIKKIAEFVGVNLESVFNNK